MIDKVIDIIILFMLLSLCTSWRVVFGLLIG